MTLDSKFLDYDFDEERHEFGEPQTETERTAMSGIARVGAILAGLGLTVLIIQFLAGVTELKSDSYVDLGPIEPGSLFGMIASFGFLAVGGAVYYWNTYAAKTAGIHNDGNFFAGSRNRGWISWVLAIAFTSFYIVLYYDPFGDDYLLPLIDIVKPFAAVFYGEEIFEEGASKLSERRWFLYGFLYTVSMVAFGLRFMMRYRHSRYQLIRTVSVTAVQVVFGFAVPFLMIAFNNPDVYFSYFWPLKPEYLYPHNFMDGGYYEQARFILYWCVGMSFVATPILTYYFGKRWYCSWVCGCGGLAETVGDQWRHLSIKKDWAWTLERWSIYSVLAIITIGTALLWIDSWQQAQMLETAENGTTPDTADNFLGDFSATFREQYAFFIVAGFAGVAGVGFYPLLGARIWCRFGCPMAAILGLFQRTASRFRITTNGGQCMSCGNCSTYCEMGIDVRAYAQRGDNIVRASCVGCGICSSVCPRGVLKLENGPNDEDRYDGVTSNPVTNFINLAKNTPPKNGPYVGWQKENDTVSASDPR